MSKNPTPYEIFRKNFLRAKRIVRIMEQATRYIGIESTQEEIDREIARQWAKENKKGVNNLWQKQT